ncbi:hypothetical protein KGQ71_00185 [Patescibacteria group bacterium]|nr:hypothetical protein [Patescibacteria group bacterium]
MKLPIYKTWSIYLLIEIIIFLPLLSVVNVLFAAKAAAAASADSTTAEITSSCQPQYQPADTSAAANDTGDENLVPGAASVAASSSQTTTDQSSVSAGVNPDPVPAFVSVSKDLVNKLPLADQITQQLNAKAIPTPNGWKVCYNQVGDILSILPFSQSVQNYFDTLSIPADRIGFSNIYDYYALTGEPCRKWLANGQCDPGTYTDGSGQVQHYYDDVYWPNGKWDPPKADLRILKTLVYLVTPKSQGGAGHEWIHVSKILQSSRTNTENAPPSQVSSTDNAATATATANATNTPVTLSTEPPDSNSAHLYDVSDHPLAEAVDIDQIDYLRITTKITQYRRLGGNSVSYKYQSIPIQVNWQTNAGAQAALPPSLSIYEGAQASITDSLLGILNNANLGNGIDPTKITLNNLGDVANLLGQSLLSGVLNSPVGSLSGWDLPSTLKLFGEAYLQQELGLAPGSLTDDSGDPIENIGRATLEYRLQLPTGSLKGDTPDQIYQNMGRRYLEDKIFNIAPGSLTPAANFPLNNRNDLLVRVGEGKVAQALSVPLSAVRVTDINKLKSGNQKLNYLFTPVSAGYIDQQLNLGFVPTDANSDHDSLGFHADDFAHPTLDLIQGKRSLTDYYRMAGERAMAGISSFSTQVAGANPNMFNNNPFLDGNPDTLLTILSSSNQQLLVNTAAFSQADLDAYMKRLQKATASYGNPTTQFSTSGNGLNDTHLVDMYNEVINADPQIGWLPPLEKALQNIQTKLDTESQDPTSPLDNDALNAQKLLNEAISSLQGFQSTIVSYICQEGQTGQGAAINTCNGRAQIDSSGKVSLKPNGVQDYMADFLATGDPAALAGIGKQKLAETLTPDAINRLNIVSQLQQDLSPSIGNVNQYGLTTSDITSKGLTTAWFQKIFKQGLSSQVFQEVGELELLRAAWNKSGLTTTVNNAVTSSSDLQTAMQTYQTLNSDYNFYATRLDRLKVLEGQLQGELTPVITDPGIKTDLASLSGNDLDSSKKSVQLQNPSAWGKLQALIAKIQDILNRASTAAPPSTQTQVQSQVTEAYHILQELEAGRSLAMDSSQTVGINTSAQGQSSDQCWTQSQIRSLVASFGRDAKKNQSLFAGYAEKTAGCHLDGTIGLPTGSFYNWLLRNNVSYNALALSVGYADATNKKQSFDDTAAYKDGDTILRAVGVSFLARMVPGYTQYAQKYGIGAQDFVDLFSGHANQVLTKIGGQMLDQQLGWKQGTASALIDPTCYDTSVKPPQPRACSAHEADNRRLLALAQLGFQQIGAPNLLDFPPDFDITAGGSIVNNYGNAYVTDDLGLAVNSFQPQNTFQDVRKMNEPDAMLHAFGLGDTPFVQILQNLKQAAAPDGDTTSALGEQVVSIINKFTDNSRNAILNGISNDQSVYWKWSAGPSDAAALATADNQTYLQAVDSLKTLLSQPSDPGDQETLQAIRALPDPRTDNTVNLVKQYATFYQAQITGFQQRVQDLAASYGIHVDTLEEFITATPDTNGNPVLAGSVIKNVGTTQLEQKLGAQITNRIPKDSPFYYLIAGFQSYTQQYSVGNCGNISLKDLVTGSSSCSIKDLDLKTFLTSNNPQYTAERGWLYDHFLANIAGSNLEKSLNIQQGTIRKMVLNPTLAPELALGQGIERLADSVFTMNPNDDKIINQLKTDFKKAFLAYFLDPQSNTFSFNSNRGKTQLEADLNSEVGYELSQVGNQWMGAPIRVADVEAIAHGDTNTMAYMGIQEMAYNVNQQLFKSNDPRATQFKISYLDVRQATGTGGITQAELDQAAASAQSDYLTSVSQKLSCGTTTQGPANLSVTQECSDLSAFNNLDCSQPANQKQCNAATQAYINSVCNSGSSDPYNAHPTECAALQQQATQGADHYSQQIKKNAQDRLQFQAYDAAAFMVDHNIPPGFTYTMFNGTTAARERMLGEFAFNSLNLGQSVFNGYLTAQEFGLLVQYAGNGFKNPPNNLIGAFNSLDRWADDMFKKNFGIDLPSGLVTSFAAWGSTGFKSSTFGSANPLNFSGAKVPSPGSLVTNLVEQKLFSWGDHMLNLPGGSVAKMYQGVQQVLQGYRALQAAEAAQTAYYGTALSMDIVGDTQDADALRQLGDQEVRQAHSQISQLKAQLISLAINTLFSDQISQVEQQLGLVPGTGAMAVSIITQLAVTGAVPWAAIAMFVAVNLFETYKVTVDERATSDGYYPYVSALGQFGQHFGGHNIPFETPLTGYSAGEFNAKDTSSYRAGIEAAARNKVLGVLTDLLLMPEQWSKVTGDDPNSLWVSQAFFYGDPNSQDDPQYAQQLDYLISRPAPYPTEGDNGVRGFGYGAIQNRATGITVQNGQLVGHPNPNYRSGFFPDTGFADHIHVSW